jgi:benzodiazapine receptor
MLQKTKRWSWLIALIPLVGGFLSSLLAPHVKEIYLALERPSFAPPVWFFPAAWTVLYLLIGIASWQVATAEAPTSFKRTGLWLFYLQLVFNFAWLPLFFGLSARRAALVALLAAFLLTAAALLFFLRVRRSAGILLLPYLLFLCYAMALNVSMIRLNG